MKNKLLILLMIYVCAFKTNAQNVLPYSQDNFCFDDIIKVNPGPLNNTKNMVVSKLTTNGSYKDVVVSDPANDRIKFYSFLSSGSFSFQTLLNVPGGFGSGQDQAIDVGFFNSDLLPDLVFTTDSFIFVFTNNDNYNFTLNQKIAIITPFINKAHFLKVDNIDNSGFDDFYFISTTGTGLTIIPFSNNGTSFFATALQNIFTTASYLPAANFDISVGNILNDPDGLKDVMLTYDQVADSVIFLENTSLPNNFSFNYHQTYLSPAPLSSPNYYIKKSEIADVNSDGKLDFVFIGTGSSFGDKIKVYAGINSFNLSFHVDIQTVCDFTDFKLGHVNGDSNIDFVGIGNVLGFSGMVAYPGNGNNITYFNPSTTISFPLIAHLDELQLNDIDANGLNDIVFKPWKGNLEHTYMIANYSNNVFASVTPSVNCGSSPSTLAATTLVTFTNSLNYNWENISTGSIVATTSAFTTTVAGQYKALVDFNMYSGNTCTLHSDTINLISNTPTIGVTQQNLKVCYAQTATTTAFGAATYTWYSGSTGAVSTTPTLSVQGLSNITYTVVGQLTNGCKGTNTVNVSLHPLNTDNIIASKNPACLGDVVTLSMPSAFSYTWNNASFTSLFSISPTVATTYTLDFIDTLGCASSKTITINVDPNCTPKIYTGVTINGDNNNNIFRIDNIENFANNTVTIYNRWGKEIFTTPKYNNTTNYWPTAEHLRTLTPSTYFFVVNFGDGTPLQKGWVELLAN